MSVKRTRGAEWRPVFSASRIIGGVEMLPDARWLALTAMGVEIGVANSIEAAVALVREETAP
jgi:hypothetical protein